MTRERLISLLILAAIALDHFYPLTRTDEVQGAWIVPALMGLGALAGAIKGKREGKNNAAAERYKAERQNAVDRYEAGLSKAKRGERLRFGNALARSRGFVVPEFDASASEGVNLDLPSIPDYKSGGFLETVGGVAGGVAGGLETEARLNIARDSLPETDTDKTTPTSTGAPPTSYTPFDPGFGSAPSSGSGQADPYASLLGRTPYFSPLGSRGRGR